MSCGLDRIQMGVRVFFSAYIRIGTSIHITDLSSGLHIFSHARCSNLCHYIHLRSGTIYGALKWTWEEGNMSWTIFRSKNGLISGTETISAARYDAYKYVRRGLDWRFSVDPKGVYRRYFESRGEWEFPSKRELTFKSTNRIMRAFCYKFMW